MPVAIAGSDRHKARLEPIGFESDLFGSGDRFRVILPASDGSHVVVFFDSTSQQGRRSTGKPLCRAELLPLIATEGGPPSAPVMTPSQYRAACCFPHRGHCTTPIASWQTVR